MITLMIILTIFGVLFLGLCGGAVLLIDPIIGIICIYGIYKLIKRFVFKKKK